MKVKRQNQIKGLNRAFRARGGRRIFISSEETLWTNSEGKSNVCSRKQRRLGCRSWWNQRNSLGPILWKPSLRPGPEAVWSAEGFWSDKRTGKWCRWKVHWWWSGKEGVRRNQGEGSSLLEMLMDKFAGMGGRKKEKLGRNTTTGPGDGFTWRVMRREDQVPKI